MKLIEPPAVKEEKIDTGAIGAGATMRLAGRMTVTPCVIFIPLGETDEEKVWNRLKYDRSSELRLHEKTERIAFPESGYTLYGVMPIGLEPTVGGYLVRCSVDHFKMH